jgi:hypothetical protein
MQPPQQGATLTLDKTTFMPGEKANVHFTAPSTFEGNAWIGIIPSNVAHGSEAENDKHDLAYQYLNKKVSGTMAFEVPAKPGSYDFRMHDTDSDGKEVASVTFTVAGGDGKAMLKLDKTVFAPGDKIMVSFTAPATFKDNAWIGIIPSNVPHGSEAENDKHDLTYQYLKKKVAGTLTFKAPEKPGAYDFRMHDTDSDGKEVASVSFTVK